MATHPSSLRTAHLGESINPNTSRPAGQSAEAGTARRALRPLAGLDEIVVRIRVGDNPARLILAISPCRSGSTALLRAFGASGIDAYFQPIKNVLRWRKAGGDYVWNLPQGPNETIYIKETLGPYFTEESDLDPIEVLLGAGCPRARLRVVLTVREPLATWTSWRKYWGPETSMALFIRACQTIERIRVRATAASLPLTMIAFDQYAGHGSEDVLSALRHNLRMTGLPRIASEWKGASEYGDNESHIIHPNEPEGFVAEGVLDMVRKSRALSYVSREQRIKELPAGEIAAVRAAGLPALYEAWVRIAEADFARWEHTAGS